MYVIEETQYENPVLIFSSFRKAEQAQQLIAYSKGLDLKQTTNWARPQEVNGIWCITHPITESSEFAERSLTMVDDVVVADMIVETVDDVTTYSLSVTEVPPTTDEVLNDLITELISKG